MQPWSNTRPMLCREFVGRHAEMDQLRTALQRASEGHPQCILVAGEAGTGKTKLCRALMESCQEQSIPILFGQAIRQDTALSFGPFLDALRRYLASSSNLSLLSDPSWQTAFSYFVRLLPGLNTLVSDYEIPPFAQTDNPLQQQQVLFHSVLSGLENLCQFQQKPVLLLLEDIHCADETSLDLLAFLVQRLGVREGKCSLLIVCTYRSEMPPETSALQQMLTHLRNQHLIQDISLKSFDQHDHWHFVSSILEQPIPEKFACTLFEWSEGSPFFTEELLSSMVASGQLRREQQQWSIPSRVHLQLPQSLTNSILQRFMSLPMRDREVLTYAAVIGRHFDFRLLAALCGLDERELVGILRRCVRFQLISEVSSTPPVAPVLYEPERYQFRHTLTREAIYDQLLGLDRRQHHQTVAETLEKLALNQIGELSQSEIPRLLIEHYRKAGIGEKVYTYALQEATRASKVFAFHEELYYLNLAQLTLPEDSNERLELLQRLAMLSLVTLDMVEAFRWLTLLRASYQRRGQPQRAALAMAKMFMASAILDANAMPDLMAEMEMLAKMPFETTDYPGENEDLLLTCSLLALYFSLDSQLDIAMEWVNRGKTLGSTLSVTRYEVTLLPAFIVEGYCKTNYGAETVEAGLAMLRSRLDFALHERLPDMIIWGYTLLFSALTCWGRSDEARLLVEKMGTYEHTSGTRPQAYLLGWQRYFAAEQWEETIDLLRREIDRTSWQDKQANLYIFAAVDRIPLAHLLLARDELEEAQIHFETSKQGVEASGAFAHIFLVWWGLAKLFALQGNQQQAQEQYEHLLERWRKTEDRALIVPVLLDCITFYADTGYLVRARHWLGVLRDLAQKTMNPVTQAACLEAQGVIESHEGKMRPAISTLRQAVKAWKQLKRVYDQTRAGHRLATLLLTWVHQQSPGRDTQQSTRAEAKALLKEAQTIYERTGTLSAKNAVDKLLTEERFQSQDRRWETIQQMREFDPLTQRETQILSHIAEGQKNREIASALGIDVKTVGLHVSHILEKLHCRSRTEAVTKAMKLGLLKME